jgi:hypothetical protein
MARITRTGTGEPVRPHWLPRGQFRCLTLDFPDLSPGDGRRDKRRPPFPFNDDPDAYAAAISAWWAEKVAAAGSKSANA